MNLMMLLEMAVSEHPDRVAIGDVRSGLTFAELYRRAGIGAAKLCRDGAGCVAYVGANSPDFPVVVFAGAWAGIPVLPLNYRLGAGQIERLIAQHQHPFVIADDNTAPLLENIGHRIIRRDEWAEASGQGTPLERWPDDPDGIAVLLYTSGTTSAPKAAILRHRHLLSYVFATVEFGGADAEAAVAVTVPPYHIAGVANLVSNLYAGRRIVYLDAFSPMAWLDAIRNEKVTNAMVVPTMLTRIVEHLDGDAHAGVPTLRTLSYGGSRIAPSVIARALQLFEHTDFVNAYGLTETSSTIAVLGPGDHRAAIASEDPAVRARLGSAGRIAPGIEAEIRNPDRSTVPPGGSGELWVRGEQVSGEYLSHQAPLDQDGWFPTRDVAHFDEDGYLFIEGRSDDTIIRGGENIAPAEIEEVLIEHPAVSDVAVVGIPDAEWGQRIAAAVVMATGESATTHELKQFVRTRLRSSKTPDVISVWAALPYTDTGKLLRRTVLDGLVRGQSEQV